MRLSKTKLIWIALGLGSAILKFALPLESGWVERYYSRGLFITIRQGLSAGLGWLPFPALYPAGLILAMWLLWRTRHWYLKVRIGSFSFTSFLASVTAFWSGVAFFFFWLWGYNYNRLPLPRQLNMEVQPITLRELRRELEEETKKVIELRALIKDLDTLAFTRDHLPADLERYLRKDLQALLKEQGFPAEGRVRSRPVIPRGIFLRFSSAGVYLPFTGEGHIDAGLHPLQWPHTLSHEMAHGYGFGDEGICNFLAYLACTRSEHPAIAYAGHLYYWRTLAANYIRFDQEGYEAFRDAKVPKVIRGDLAAIYRQLEAYPDLFPGLQPAIYDAFLKAQGVEEGMLSYNQVVMLVSAWKKMHKS